MNIELFGDYELLIDELLSGDPDIKQRVAEADQDGRRGYSTLLYYLRKHKVTVPEHLRPILETCMADQEYWAEFARDDMRNIRKLPSGRFQARVKFEWNRYTKTFDTHLEARRWRDRLEVYFDELQLFEKLEADEPLESEGEGLLRKLDRRSTDCVGFINVSA